MLRNYLLVMFLLSCILVFPTNQAKAQDRAIRRTESAATNQMHTEQRVALVIGNGDYDSSPLRNPVNDARAMARTLRDDLGFAVDEQENLDWQRMNEVISRFGQRLLKGGVGLFYYAGHGIQLDGRNYLIPVHSNIHHESEVKYRAVDAGLVLAQMENARNRLNIVILDACRDNPFARSFRNSGQGLASMDAPAGTIIAYATSPGKTASDGAGENSLYTGELIQQMQVAGVRLEDVFSRVRRVVRTQTNNQQIPWESTSLEGLFYFKLPGREEPVEPAKDGQTTEEAPPSGRRGGSLKVETKPSGARIFLDGREVGVSPLSLSSLQPGAVNVQAKVTGYQAREQSVTVREGRMTAVNLVLSQIARKGRIYINVQPQDASIKILNVKAPYRQGIELQPGEYELEVARSGHRSWKRTVSLKAGEDLQLQVRLEVAETPPASTTPSAETRKNDPLASVKEEEQRPPSALPTTAKEQRKLNLAILPGLENKKVLNSNNSARAATGPYLNFLQMNYGGWIEHEVGQLAGSSHLFATVSKEDEDHKPDSMWHKGFTTRPRMEVICDRGKRLGADAVFTYKLDLYYDSSSSVVIYLIDVKSGKEYTLSSDIKQYPDAAVVSSVVKNLAQQVFEEYRKSL